ncbi:MAG: efflux RND transporter periplasmic adaptor subunit [Pseudomonadota bacterium]
MPLTSHARPFVAWALSSILATSGVATTAPASAQGQRPAMVGVETVEARTVADTVPVIGRLVPVTNSVVAARVAGVVERVPIVIGDRVRAGRILVKLDDRLLRIERNAANASLREAKAGRDVALSNVDLARQAFERMERLSSSVAFSRGQFEDLREQLERAQSEIARAEAQILNAEAALARAEYSVTHTEIRAPFDGIVVEKSAQPGQYINVGNPILTLLDIEQLEIEVDVPSRIIASMAPGTEVAAIFDDNKAITATVRAVIPQERVTTRTRPVRLVGTIPNEGVGTAVGQSVTVQVPVSAPRQAVTVPKDALVQGRGGWMVYGVVDDTATPMPIQIGNAVEDRFEVLSGLEEGTIVVVRGNERLRPGQPVMAAPPTPEEPASESSENSATPNAEQPTAAKTTASEGTAVQ